MRKYFWEILDLAIIKSIVAFLDVHDDGFEIRSVLELKEIEHEPFVLAKALGHDIVRLSEESQLELVRHERLDALIFDLQWEVQSELLHRVLREDMSIQALIIMNMNKHDFVAEMKKSRMPKLTWFEVLGAKVAVKGSFRALASFRLERLALERSYLSVSDGKEFAQCFLEAKAPLAFLSLDMNDIFNPRTISSDNTKLEFEHALLTWSEFLSSRSAPQKLCLTMTCGSTFSEIRMQIDGISVLFPLVNLFMRLDTTCLRELVMFEIMLMTGLDELGDAISRGSLEILRIGQSSFLQKHAWFETFFASCINSRLRVLEMVRINARKLENAKQGLIRLLTESNLHSVEIDNCNFTSALWTFPTEKKIVVRRLKLDFTQTDFTDKAQNLWSRFQESLIKSKNLERIEIIGDPFSTNWDPVRTQFEDQPFRTFISR